MKAEFLAEPELEFGGGGRHVDIRFGLMNYGPLDVGLSRAPRAIRVGVVGSAGTIEGVRTWIERCRGGIDAKPSRYPNLFPRFPGFAPDHGFGTELFVDDRLCRPVANKRLAALAALERAPAVTEAALTFFEEASYLVEGANPNVIIVAPPRELLDVMDSGSPGSSVPAGREESDARHVPYFHDILKARGLALGVPLQMVRPETYDERQRPKQRRRRWIVSSTQDEATRAWNFHTALYYKAGGVPWRLVRDPTQLTSCFVGVSFYRSAEGDRLLTSMAQVFNERGDGMILRGGAAEIDKRDRTSHLSGSDANALLSAALDAYRQEHKTLPARVVVHKTSRHGPDERAGFRSAADAHRVESIDLVSVAGEAGTRLFRTASFPPLRGTRLSLDDENDVLYTRGSVDFFMTYPGMYVPAPILLRYEDVEQTPRFLAEEILALSKMNWNNSQFDGALPITLRAARQVGDILRHAGPSDPIQACYAFYM
jgi:hypothetical protein